MAIEELAMQKLRLLSSVSGELPYSAFFVVDEKLEYVLAGGEALVTTGYTPADFIGRSVREMVPPASAGQAEADYRSVFAGAPFVREHASMLLRLPGQAIEAWVDPVRLAQALNNMLANAVKYTQVQGSIDVALAGDAGGFTIEVRDNGAGIAPAALAGVFELFNRGQPAVGQDDQGLGIGMWLAHQFVREHGGSIVAASDGPGAGSCFTVWLPLGLPQGALEA